MNENSSITSFIMRMVVNLVIACKRYYCIPIPDIFVVVS